MPRSVKVSACRHIAPVTHCRAQPLASHQSTAEPFRQILREDIGPLSAQVMPKGRQLVDLLREQPRHAVQGGGRVSVLRSAGSWASPRFQIRGREGLDLCHRPWAE